MSIKNNEITLISFIMTPQNIDSEVDYIQSFDETKINKHTLRELCNLMKQKTEELTRMCVAREIVEDNKEE